MNENKLSQIELPKRPGKPVLVSLTMSQEKLARLRVLSKLLNTSISAILRSGIEVAELKAKELEVEKE